MLDKLSKIGGATIVGLGLVVAVTEPATDPMPYPAEVELAATVLAIGGLGYETVEPELIKRVAGGRFANEENLVGLAWPGELAPFNGTLTLNESVAVGVETLDAAIRNTPGQKIVVGASGSTLAVNEVMRRLAKDPNGPAADEISFVVLGDADRGVFKQMRGLTLPIFDYTVPGIPVTKYDVTVVAGEYDGMGDWPDRSWNLLAVLNALAGTGLLQQIIDEPIVEQYRLEDWGSVHYDAMFADLDQVPEKNVTTTVNRAGGTTTAYLVPTADLPLLRPLKNLGVQQDVIDGLEKLLRPIIDSAYIRNDAVRNTPPSFGSVTRPGGRAAAHTAATVSPLAAAVKLPAAAKASTPVRATAAKATAAKATAANAPATTSTPGAAGSKRSQASSKPGD
jgi:hypothetical protein